MALRNILRDNDPGLRKKSRVVKDFNERLHILLDDMRETMLSAKGLGLAAPQVGVLRRVAVVVDVPVEPEPEFDEDFDETESLEDGTLPDGAEEPEEWDEPEEDYDDE